MTTPDHRPYLTATDLRTPEDVLAFVHDFVVDPDVEWDLSEVHNFLRRTIDRERRQACRRAALAEWRRVCELVRWCDAYRNSDAAWHKVAPSLWRALTRALAFRAAAREP